MKRGNCKRVFVLLVASSCTLHPSYERPVFESANDWRTPIESQNAIDIDWWKQFNDPVLNNLIAEALTNNQELQVAIARVDQFKAQLGIANSKFYPQIEADAMAQRQKISSSITALPSGIKPIFNAFGTIFKASYLVDLWGEVRSASQAAYHEWLGSIDARRTVVLGLVSSLASAYLQLRQFDQQLSVSEQTLKSRNESLYLAKVRYELGLTSEMEVEQALSEVEIIAIEVENFQILISETENLISVLLGKPSMPIERGKPIDKIPMPPAVPSYLPSEIVCQRPDVQAAEQKLIAANARIGVARSKFFPQINLTGALGTESVNLNQFLKTPSFIFEYGSTILQEIFTGGHIMNDVRLTEAIQREALHQYLTAILAAFKEVNDALTAHKIYLELVKTQSIRVEALKRYLNLSDLRYKEGETDYLTYLDAERQYFRAQIDYEETVGNSFISLVQIYESLGGPWVVDADSSLNQKDEEPSFTPL